MARINLPDILVHREDFADFMCGFCQMALERPRAAPCCGNCLCEECWVLFRMRGDKRCIACRAALMNIRANRLRPSPYADRMIAQQKVRCENDECAWSGRWDAYKDHKRNGCPLQPSAGYMTPANLGSAPLTQESVQQKLSLVSRRRKESQKREMKREEELESLNSRRQKAKKPNGRRDEFAEIARGRKRRSHRKLPKKRKAGAVLFD